MSWCTALVFFGVFANKKHQWAFVTGMVLYALDAAIYVLFQDWLGVAFHRVRALLHLQGLHRLPGIPAADRDVMAPGPTS